MIFLRKYWYIAVSVFISCFLFNSVSSGEPVRVPKIVFCDVGQGDTTLFLYRDFQMLVDAGPDNAKAVGCLNRYVSSRDKTIELMVATHPDADHIGGFASVLEFYQVDSFLMLPVLKETKVFENLINALEGQKESGKAPKIVTEEFDQINFNVFGFINLSFWNDYKTITSSITSNGTEINNIILLDNKFYSLPQSIDHNSLSIVTFLSIGETQILLAGDLDVDGERAMMKSRLLGKVEVLKVAHHGSKTSSSNEFLAKIEPEKAVISVSAKNTYGHPNKEVMANLEALGVQNFLTNESGDVVFIYTNGVWALEN